MDLLDFEAQALYFDEPLPDEAAALIDEGSRLYGEGGAELPLLRAYLLAPDSLTVLVALYRFYYYQHRLADAEQVAARAMEITSRRLGFPQDWRDLDQDYLGAGALQSMGLVRFHLMTLKAAGFLKLRMGEFDLAGAMLEKLVELDSSDRLGVQALLEVAREAKEPMAA